MAGSFESYDYGKLNRVFNGSRKLDVRAVNIPESIYKFGVGLSYNLLDVLSPQMKNAKEAKNYMFEMLNAVDEALRSDPENEVSNVEELDRYLKKMKVSKFVIENGFIKFLRDGGAEIFRVALISSRQEKLKQEVYGDSLVLKSGLLQEIKRKNKENLEKLKIRVTKTSLGPADNSEAIEVKIPKLKADAYALPREFWISSKNPPEVIAKQHRGKVVCIVYAGEMLAKEVGSRKLLYEMGYKDKLDAWEFRNALAKKGSIEVEASLGDHLTIERGRIKEIDTHGEAYVQDVLNFRKGLDRVANSGRPVLMGLYNRHSDYKGSMIDYNSRLDSSQRSLNTHMTYFLGRGFRPTDVQPAKDETVEKFVVRALHMTEGFTELLKTLRVKVDGKVVDIDSTTLTPESKVEIEDYYFAHHYDGSKVTSFTELMSKGRFVPTDILTLNTDGVPKENLPAQPEDERLKPKNFFYLNRRQSIKKAFLENVSPDIEHWDIYLNYLSYLGFDTRKTRYEMDPLPVPDMSLFDNPAPLNEAIEADAKKRMEIYEKEHPGEHLVAITLGKSPWDILGKEFEGMSRPLSSKEKKYVLEQVDKLNKDVDLRTFERAGTDKDGKALKVTDYVSWGVGKYLWYSDELIETLKDNIRYRRIMENVHVPPNIRIATEDGPEDVEISEHERQVITNASIYPEDRMFLTLALLNEQKGGNWRRFKARAAEKLGLHKEESVGLFQVKVRQSDMEQMSKNGYVFANLEEYRDKLIEDDNLNAKVALINFSENKNAYLHFMKLNDEEEPELHDKNFVRAVLTCYNRPPSYVYAAVFSYQAQKISDAFGLKLSHKQFEEGAEKIRGNDKEGIARFWKVLATNMDNAGLIKVSDRKVFDQSKLIIDDKEAFLESEIYKSVKKAYEQKTGKKLSMLLETEQDYEDTAIFNYGYRATRLGQINDILLYSKPKNEEMLQRGKPVEIKTLASVQRNRNSKPA